MIVTVANPIYDAELRHEMNVEDEYFTALENRDTTIMLKEQQIKKLDAQLAEKDGQLAEKEDQLAEKDGQLAEKDGQLAEKDGQLAEKDKALLVSAKALKDAGIPDNQIAAITMLPLDVIESM